MKLHSFCAMSVSALPIVALDENEYLEALGGAAASGMINDAMIAKCALKAKAQTIYTWNIKHFSRLGDHVASRVRVPRWDRLLTQSCKLNSYPLNCFASASAPRASNPRSAPTATKV
jgi:hypothetical protein